MPSAEPAAVVLEAVATVVKGTVVGVVSIAGGTVDAGILGTSEIVTPTAVLGGVAGGLLAVCPGDRVDEECVGLEVCSFSMSVTPGESPLVGTVGVLSVLFGLSVVYVLPVVCTTVVEDVSKDQDDAEVCMRVVGGLTVLPSWSTVKGDAEVVPSGFSVVVAIEAGQLENAVVVDALVEEVLVVALLVVRAIRLGVVKGLRGDVRPTVVDLGNGGVVLGPGTGLGIPDECWIGGPGVGSSL